MKTRKGDDEKSKAEGKDKEDPPAVNEELAARKDEPPEGKDESSEGKDKSAKEKEVPSEKKDEPAEGKDESAKEKEGPSEEKEDPAEGEADDHEGKETAAKAEKRASDDDETPAEEEETEEEREAKALTEALPARPVDAKVLEQQELISKATPETPLELALNDELKRKEAHIERLTGEVHKLKAFISKRKQTYKRKRKDEGAPTRALSAYNIFVQDRFSKLAKENEEALQSADTNAELKRVPPATLVASTGNQWKELSSEEKAFYEKRAEEDRKRYQEQMSKYQPPDKQANRKRNKTGYNMFFSAHVLSLKQTEAGVPSERGSVARLVGNAWKQLSNEEKQYYERQADKQNGANPIEKDEEDDEDEPKRPPPPEGHPYAHLQQPPQHGGEPHGGPYMTMAHGPPPPHHQQMDPRGLGAYAPYPGHHMAYSQAAAYQSQHDYHAAQSQHGRYPGGRPHSGYRQGYPPHHYPYDGSGGSGGT